MGLRRITAWVHSWTAALESTAREEKMKKMQPADNKFHHGNGKELAMNALDYEISDFDRKQIALYGHKREPCEICGKITDVEEPALYNLLEQVTNQQIFTITNNHINVYGMCKYCKK